MKPLWHALTRAMCLYEAPDIISCVEKYDRKFCKAKETERQTPKVHILYLLSFEAAVYCDYKRLEKIIDII